MKKTLLISFSLLVLTVSSFAQNCPHDTSYSYKFVDGSTTKTPAGRRIFYGPQVTGAEADRAFTYQVFKNGGYVNDFKYEFVIHQPSGSYSEYLYAEWDSASAVWKPVYKENLLYASNNLWNEKIIQQPNQAGVLENKEKIVRTFNTKNRETSFVSFAWASGAWRNKGQDLYTFQADTLETLKLTQIWDTTSSTWKNLQKTEKTFDANAKETSNAFFNWDASNSAWKGIQKQLSTYNAQGFLTERETLSWDLGTSDFIKFIRLLYVNNPNGKILTQTYQQWNTSSNTYITGSITSNTYNSSDVLLNNREEYVNSSGVVTNSSTRTITLDAGNRPLVIFDQDSSSAGGGVVRPLRRWTYTYNANGNKLTELYEERPSAADTLRNNFRRFFTYNTNNQLLIESRDNWNATSATWVLFAADENEYNSNGLRTATDQKNTWNTTGNYFNTHNRTEYICKAATVGIDEAMQNDFKVYPNPIASGSFLNIETFNSGKYLMLDFNGRTVKMGEVNAGVNTISTNDLSAGFYLLKLNSKTFKVIIQ